LSIGVQSFRALELHALGRIHSAHDAVRAFELARRAGFPNVNLDLMYGLPKAGVDGALEDLAVALDLEPAHISWYQLTIEPNTAFHRRPPPLPADDTVVEIEHRGRELLARRGYRRYEISAYARSGKTCTHNLNYWQFGDYLGVGAGAHGKVTLAAAQAIERRSKARNPRTYAAATQRDAETVERIDAAPQVALEFLMNALRLVDGVPEACFEQRAGQSIVAVRAPVEEAVDRGWLADSRGELRPTAAGLRLLNRVLELFC
jgi:putative oxygen-independent coproporphyrinogen III oxidase